MMRLHVTYTGGTIGMVESPDGLVPGADLRGWLFQLLRQGSDLDSSKVSLTALDPLIDSSNATPGSWQSIIDDLWRFHDSADAFIVLHGTDTMSYTTSALSYALTDFGKPVVFTGSQHPLGKIESDATANVTGAFNAVLSGHAQGVELFFGHHLFAGNRVTKASSWAFEGFASPITGPVAQSGTPWHWNDAGSEGCGWRNPAPYRQHDIAVVTMVPGISADRLASMLAPHPQAVLIRAYGVGNMPDAVPGLTDAIRAVADGGAPVIVASQCQQAEVMLGRYQAGAGLAEVGACSAVDMTFEAVYTKIMFLLSQGLGAADFTDWVGRPIAGEVSSPQQ